MAGGGSYTRAPTSRTSLDEESVSRILLEANDAEAQRATSSCRWMVGFHGVALLVVAVLASVEIALGSGSDGKATPSPAGNNYTTVSLNVVHKPPPPVHAAPKIGSDACAWGGNEDCSINRCCNLEGHQCYVRDSGFAGCRAAPPEGWDGELIGGFRGYEIPKATPDRCSATSLWCVAVVATLEEQQLLEMQEKHKVGVYACDAHAVFEGAAAPKDEVEAVAADARAVADIWEDHILKSGEWQKHDWTVKVEVDLVFFPARLKQHLRKLCPPMGGGLYLKNANVQSGFLGSLEIFSQEAIRMLAATGKKCLGGHVQQKSETGFVKACMDAIGVGSMTDTSLLDDQYTRGGLAGMSRGVCQSGETVGFHPFKTEWVWESCHDAASRISDGPRYKCLSMSCGTLLNRGSADVLK